MPQTPASVAAIGDDTRKRRLYFEDVEVRRSRTRGVACRVTLRKGDETFVGESEGNEENERQRRTYDGGRGKVQLASF